MNRMALVAVALCAVLLTTVGAGVVAAKQGGPGPLPGRVFQFDVTRATTGETVGTLVINTNTWTYVFNAKGLEPSKTYYLVGEEKMVGLEKVTMVGSENATKAGTLHLQGAWDPNTVELYTASASAFRLEDSPIAQAGLSYGLDWYYVYSPNEGRSLEVRGFSYTYVSDPSVKTYVYVEGVVSISYLQDGVLKPLGKVHTTTGTDFDFQTSFPLEPSFQPDPGKESILAVMDPDDPFIPNYLSYANPLWL